MRPCTIIGVCLLVGGSAGAAEQTVLLELRVMEGEGVVSPVSTRAARPIVVQVTDETGRPVEGAAVSFRLPEEEPTGVFANSLRTDLVMTGADGKATLAGIRWGAVPGPVKIRVTAAKDQARAGILISQYLSETAAPEPEAVRPEAARGGIVISRRGDPTVRAPRRWIYYALVAGAAGAGFAAARGRGGATAAPAAAAAVVSGPQIGAPTITIGRP